MIDTYTKFEVSNLTRARDAKGCPNVTKIGHYGGYESLKVIGNATVR